MKNKISIFLISLIIISGCDYPCPGFDKELLNWMPYNLNDELVYINQYNDTLKFIVDAKEVSPPYETSRKNRDYCESHVSFNIREVLQPYINVIFSNIYQLEDNITIATEIDVENSSGYCYIETNNLDNDIKELTINNVEYKTIILEKDTLKYDDKIWKIIIAKNYGIIQFHDRETGNIWTLQEK